MNGGSEPWAWAMYDFEDTEKWSNMAVLVAMAVLYRVMGRGEGGGGGPLTPPHLRALTRLF